MEIENAIFERRTIRSYTNQKIDDDILLKIISAGTYAPSATNSQSWKFIIIDDYELKKSISTNNGGVVQNKGSNLILNSPYGILVLYRNDKSKNYRMYKDHIQSASACIQNMLLMAHSLSIGACWICKLPTQSYMRKLLKIPKHYDVIAYITLGKTLESLSQYTIEHFDNNLEQAKVRPRKYTLNQLVTRNEFIAHDNNQGSFKYPYLLSILHFIQLNVKNTNHDTIIKFILRKLFNILGANITK